MDVSFRIYSEAQEVEISMIIGGSLFGAWRCFWNGLPGRNGAVLAGQFKDSEPVFKLFDTFFYVRVFRFPFF